MKISQQIFERLLNLPAVPPETGGILGGKGEMIDIVVIDTNKSSCYTGIYAPDALFLNNCIQKWATEGIKFMGMFHTHAPNWPDLSSEDRKYMKLIMESMPESIRCLYFPLIFPTNEIKAFQAVKVGEQVVISEDFVEII